MQNRQLKILIAFNDAMPKKTINDFIMVTTIEAYDDLNSKVNIKYGKCRSPQINKIFTSCTYSIGKDPEMGTGQIATIEKNIEKHAVIFMLSVETGDGI